MFPRDNAPRSNFGVIYGYLGQYDKAVEEIQDAVRLNPGSAVGYTNLVSDYAALDRLNDAKEIYRRALDRKLENPFLHLNRYGVAFLENDAAEMQQQLVWATGKRQAENLLLSAQSDTEVYSGHFQRARDLSRRAADSARRSTQDETAAEWEMNSALREAEFGFSANARAQTTAVLAKLSNRELQILAALAYARAGEPLRAGQLADKLQSRFPLDTALNRYWLPCIRSGVELNARDPVNSHRNFKGGISL